MISVGGLSGVGGEGHDGGPAGVPADSVSLVDGSMRWWSTGRLWQRGKSGVGRGEIVRPGPGSGYAQDGAAPGADDPVAALVRQDGRKTWPQFDRRTSRRIADELEPRYGLPVTPQADRTNHRQPQSAETSKARRLGRTLTTRDELRRRVRAAVAASLSEKEFFARLADDGLLAKLRPSQTNPDGFTGSSVVLPAERDKEGEPVWFGASISPPTCPYPSCASGGAPPPRPATVVDRTDEAVRVSAAQRARTLS